MAKKPPQKSRTGSVPTLLLRGMSLFLALYVLISLVALVRGNAYNMNTWWIDLGFLPNYVGLALQLLVCAGLFIFALYPRAAFWLQILTAATFTLFFIFSLINAVGVYTAVQSGSIELGFPIPFSLFIAAAFLLLALGVTTMGKHYVPAETDSASAMYSPSVAYNSNAAYSIKDAYNQSKASNTYGSNNNKTSARPTSLAKTTFFMLLAIILCGVLFPLGQVYCFGKTHYFGKVDAIVVLGARAYPDNSLSLPLKDRVNTAIECYFDGQCDVLIMSGGVDDDGTDEAHAMALYAIDAGVPAEDIITDSQGNSTGATAKNVVAIARKYNYNSLGAVSSYYHMARIKMLFLANGMNVTTVPATATLELEGGLRFGTVREIPGWWYYWFSAML